MKKTYKGTTMSDVSIGRYSVGDEPSKSNSFIDLIKQIDMLVESIPQISLPSSLLGKCKYDILKTVLSNMSNNMNVGRASMLACSVINLLASHSGYSRISRVSGFVQNCMAIYTLGNTINDRLKLKWNPVDLIYTSTTMLMPDAGYFKNEWIQSLTDKYNNRNVTASCNISMSGAYSIVKMFNANTPVEWFCDLDQQTHVIEPLLTNIERAERVAVYDPDGDHDNDCVSLHYTVKEDIGADCKIVASERAMFVFKFDEYTVYLHIGLSPVRKSSVSDDDSADNSSSNDRIANYGDAMLMFVPQTYIAENVVEKVLRTILKFFDSLFAMFLETDEYVFSLDSDGELIEYPRPKNIPTEFVSNKIPKIISAMRTMYDKSLSRGYSFVGPAGTGKTIAAEQISEQFKDVCTFRIVSDNIIDSDVMEILINYIKAVKKCLIILDDMDTTNLSAKNGDVCAFLAFFDKLNLATKNDKVSYAFIATVNDPSRINQTIMSRSGRIDETIKIGYPTEDAIRYLFKYNDKLINPDKLTDFSDSKFDECIAHARALRVTVADISNIFADMAIYNGHIDEIEPSMVEDALQRIDHRNQMAMKNYLGENANDIDDDDE